MNYIVTFIWQNAEIWIIIGNYVIIMAKIWSLGRKNKIQRIIVFRITAEKYFQIVDAIIYPKMVINGVNI